MKKQPRSFAEEKSMAKEVYDAAFEKKITEYFDATLPDKIYDAHVHISRSFTERRFFIGNLPFS